MSNQPEMNEEVIFQEKENKTAGIGCEPTCPPILVGKLVFVREFSSLISQKINLEFFLSTFFYFLRAKDYFSFHL